MVTCQGVRCPWCLIRLRTIGRRVKATYRGTSWPLAPRLLGRRPTRRPITEALPWGGRPARSGLDNRWRLTLGQYRLRAARSQVAQGVPPYPTRLSTFRRKSSSDASEESMSPPTSDSLARSIRGISA